MSRHEHTPQFDRFAPDAKPATVSPEALESVRDTFRKEAIEYKNEVVAGIRKKETGAAGLGKMQEAKRHSETRQAFESDSPEKIYAQHAVVELHSALGALQHADTAEKAKEAQGKVNELIDAYEIPLYHDDPSSPELHRLHQRMVGAMPTFAHWMAHKNAMNRSYGFDSSRIDKIIETAREANREASQE